MVCELTCGLKQMKRMASARMSSFRCANARSSLSGSIKPVSSSLHQRLLASGSKQHDVGLELLLRGSCPVVGFEQHVKRAGNVLQTKGKPVVAASRCRSVVWALQQLDDRVTPHIP